MNTEELKRLAECTCPVKAMPFGNCCKVRTAFEKWYLAQPDGRIQPFDVWQGAWIACANPAAILALIAERDALLEALKGYVTAIANAGGGDKDMFIAAIREADNKARAAITKAESK